ncbi:MAG: hypothetical protein ING09_13835 [Roseomonas sp.]|nr:hypothetical protein [Roseomonas sp.]MCA3290753.1 hypothetical protein [Roseomonas sp.]MCA3296414.1 hypothetical protein [Roseomonas sp.]
MTRLDPPLSPRSSLDRGTRSATHDGEMERMRAAAWHRHGVAALSVHDITDPWLRQAIINEATRRWGVRKAGGSHGQ